MAGKKYATTDPDVMRRWAEARHGTPVLFHRGNLDSNDQWPGFAFPGYDSPNSYEEITWQELFNKRAEAHLVFLYQEMTDTGESSLYNRFVSRQVANEAVSNTAARHDPSPKSSALGPTESHNTTLALGKRAYRRYAWVQALSKFKMAGLIIVSVLVAALIIVVFWPPLT
jgi:hypothetical protein